MKQGTYMVHLWTSLIFVAQYWKATARTLTNPKFT